MIESRGTSRGTQKKYASGDYWYKVDSYGYEGAAEYVASRLLDACCNYRYARYIPLNIEGKRGCKSKNFLYSGERIVTAWRIIENFDTDFKFRKQKRNNSTKERIEFFVDFVEKNVKVTGFGEYLTFIFELDRLILNEDRHLNNICLVRDESGKADLSPIFDQGMSLLSRLQEYPWTMSLSYASRSVKAMPFSSSFGKQVAVAESLYGQQLAIDMDKLNWHEMEQTLLSVYKDKRYLRCRNVLKYQLERYPQYSVSSGNTLKKLTFSD